MTLLSPATDIVDRTSDENVVQEYYNKNWT